MGHDRDYEVVGVFVQCSEDSADDDDDSEGSDEDDDNDTSAPMTRMMRVD